MPQAIYPDDDSNSAPDHEPQLDSIGSFGKISQVDHGGIISQTSHCSEEGLHSVPVSQVGHKHRVSQIAWPISQVGHRYHVSQFRHGHKISHVGEVSFSQCKGQVIDPCIDGELPCPLRVVHVGSVMYQAGIEVWLQSLIANVCSRRLQFTRCVVASNYYDPDVVSQLSVPVDVGAGAAGVERAARNCDVMLISGPPEIGQWLAEYRPTLCIGVAHGDGHGTREILEACAGILDHTIAVSHGVAETACKGFEVTTIHNGVDVAHLTSTRSRELNRAALGFRHDDFVIGSVCRLSHEKRPERLIEAIAHLPERFKLLLVGWGPLQASLEYLANRIAPGRVVFLHAKSNLGDCFKAMDAFALVSSTEGYGLAIMEAMFMGLPIIVTNVGFVPEWIHDRINGIVVDGSVEQIVHAVMAVAEHPRWAAGVAEEGRLTAERHGYASQMARRYEELLLELWRRKTQA